MLLARILGALLALVLTVGLSQSAPPPAQAARPKHDLVAKGYEQGTSDRFFVKGRVPTYPDARIRVLRNLDGGKFDFYKRVKTDSSGRFRARIYQVGHRKTCFKVQVPGTPTYRKTTSPNLGCITRR